MWDYEKIGNETAMKMMLIDGIREPTLTQVQEKSSENVCPDEDFLSVPAWKFFSEPHPGLPEHYHTVSKYNHLTLTPENDLQLPELPFSLIDREIKYKLLITLNQGTQSAAAPSLEKLSNGTIIITSNSFPMDNGHETEIFLNLHKKMIPCCFITSMDEIIINSPLTTGSRVRCYYLVLPSAVTEATFIKSNCRVIYRSDYQEMWLHGSTSYQQMFDAAQESK